MKIEQKHFDAMMNGTNCRFWNKEEKGEIGEIESLDNLSTAPFYCVSDNTIDWYSNCEPVKTETYVKEWFGIAKQLHEDDYQPFTNEFLKDRSSGFRKEYNIVWYNDMWVTCGLKYKNVNGSYRYRPEWLEER